MFHKYRILGVLGSGSSGVVYLVEHMELKVYRAIKCLSKTHSMQPEFFLETNLLNNLNYPAIPRIYEVAEDGEAYYIVEEYVRGESLQSLIERVDKPNLCNTIELALQLSDIFIFLHEECVPPVIYLDLKPEHIIVYENQVKIIDFGAASCNLQGKNMELKGTKEFSAPELIKNKSWNHRVDIYSIGKVLEKYYFNEEDKKYAVLKKCCHPGARAFKKILQKAAAKEPEKRYESVREMKHDLQILYQKTTWKTQFFQKEHLRKNIVIVGSEHHIGVTHMAKALEAYMNRCGRKTHYLAGTKFPVMDVSYQGDFVKIYDLGVIENYEQLELMEEADLILLVVGCKEWEQEKTLQAYHKIKYHEQLKVVCNMSSRTQAVEIAQIINRKVFCFPLDENPYVVTKKKEKLFRAMEK